MLALVRSHTGRDAVLTEENAYLVSEHLRVSLTDVLGISFDIAHANVRESIEGKITVVKKSNHSWHEFWPWFLLLVLHLILGRFLWLSFGPLTSALVVLGFAVYGFKRSHVPPLFSACALFSVFGVSFLAFFLLVLLCGLGGLPSIRFALPKRAQMPFVFEYSEQEIPRLLQIRSTLYASPYRVHIREVWIGNRYCEWILSLLLPNVVYNHVFLRRALHWIIEFIVPFLAIVQGVAILLPWFLKHLHLLALLCRNDTLVNAMRSILRTLRLTNVAEALYACIERFGQHWWKSMLALLFEQYFLRAYLLALYIKHELMGLVVAIYSLVTLVIEPLQKAIILPFRLLFLNRLGQRSPEMLVSLMKRVGETFALLWDRIVQKCNLNKPSTPTDTNPSTTHIKTS